VHERCAHRTSAAALLCRVLTVPHPVWRMHSRFLCVQETGLTALVDRGRDPDLVCHRRASRSPAGRCSRTSPPYSGARARRWRACGARFGTSTTPSCRWNLLEETICCLLFRLRAVPASAPEVLLPTGFDEGATHLCMLLQWVRHIVSRSLRSGHHQCSAFCNRIEFNWRPALLLFASMMQPSLPSPHRKSHEAG